MHAKIMRFALILLAAVLFFPASCKKSATAPESEVWELPVIWVDSYSMSFTVSQFAANPENQILQVKNSGAQTLSYEITDDADFYEIDWLTVVPSTGASNGEIIEHEIVVDKTGLESREDPYTAKITIKSSECYNSPQEVDVSLEVTDELPPRISVAPKNLGFSTDIGAANPAGQEITVRNSGGVLLEYEITANKPWIVVDPSEGTSRGAEQKHTVLIDSTGLDAGTHNGVIKVSDPSASNNPQRVNVTLTVRDEPPPEISVTPGSLSFAAQVNGADPSPQSIQVANSGEGTLRYSIEWEADWLSVSPTSGNSQGAARNHTVSVDTSGMSEGNYSGTITVRDPEASNNTQIVRVSLELRDTPPEPPPSDENKIFLTKTKNSGAEGETVTFEVRIDGNQDTIISFGLELTFDDDFFDYVSTSNGNLTSSWGNGVDGEYHPPGLVIAGGWGGGNSIPVGSQGSIVKITLKVSCPGCSGGETTTVCIQNLTDDIKSAKINLTNACVNFSHK